MSIRREHRPQIPWLRLLIGLYLIIAAGWQLLRIAIVTGSGHRLSNPYYKPAAVFWLCAGTLVLGSGIWSVVNRNQLISGNTETPPLVITKRLKGGIPVRGSCPLCEAEVSTEAFADNVAYPHEQTLVDWYRKHFDIHVQK